MMLSPQQLCQELVRDDPWKVLVVCLMLNQTTGIQVRKVFPEFFGRWPSPAALDKNPLLLEEECIREVLRPLGFQNRRLDRILGMTWDFVMLDIVHHPEMIDQVHGVGKYASDSFKMFVGGYLVLDVQDKELKRYVKWARSQAAGVEAHNPQPG